MVQRGVAGITLAPHAGLIEAAREAHVEARPVSVQPLVVELGVPVLRLLAVLIPGPDALLKEARLGPVTGPRSAVAAAEAEGEREGADLAMAPMA